MISFLKSYSTKLTLPCWKVMNRIKNHTKRLHLDLSVTQFNRRRKKSVAMVRYTR